MANNVPYRSGARVRHVRPENDATCGGGRNVPRAHSNKKEEKHFNSLVGDLDALLKAEPGSEAAALAAIQIKAKRLQKSGLRDGDST